MAHTPTPWKVDAQLRGEIVAVGRIPDGAFWYRRITDANGYNVLASAKDVPYTEKELHDNAAFIVKAANNFELMRRLLAEFIQLIDDGLLVRDISHDHESGWAMKQLPIVQTTQDTVQLLKELEA